MKSRRNFIQNGSIAALTIIASKPFKSIANTTTKYTNLSSNSSKLAFVHNTHNKNYQQIIVSKIKQLKNSKSNIVLLETTAPTLLNPIHYDVSFHSDMDTSLTGSSYKIIFKGDIKVGIIKANGGEKGTVQRINALSAYLKKDKHCHIVVCLSQLGFKNKVILDDIKLAQQSSNLDIIIGGNTANYSNQAFVARNNNREEVVIQSSMDNGFAMGNIEVEFDTKQNKKNIAINNLLSRLPATS